MKREIKESILDVGSGFFLAVIIQITIFPLFGLKVTIFENFQIALIFTVVSMTRSAIWRWWFRSNDARIKRLLKSNKVSKIKEIKDLLKEKKDESV